MHNCHAMTPQSRPIVDLDGYGACFQARRGLRTQPGRAPSPSRCGADPKSKPTSCKSGPLVNSCVFKGLGSPTQHLRIRPLRRLGRLRLRAAAPRPAPPLPFPSPFPAFSRACDQDSGRPRRSRCAGHVAIRFRNPSRGATQAGDGRHRESPCGPTEVVVRHNSNFRKLLLFCFYKTLFVGAGAVGPRRSEASPSNPRAPQAPGLTAPGAPR